MATMYAQNLLIRSFTIYGVRIEIYSIGFDVSLGDEGFIGRLFYEDKMQTTTNVSVSKISIAKEAKELAFHIGTSKLELED